MIDTTYHIIQTTNDSVSAITVNSPNGDNGSGNISITVQLFWSAIAAVIGAVLGGLITIWYKKKELASMRETLELQKRIFNEEKINNDNRSQAEWERIDQISRKYELSLKKFDFQHLAKVLEYADDKDEKAQMLKEFAIMLTNYNPTIPDYVFDMYEYEQFMSQDFYYKLDNLQADITNLLTKHPSTYLSFHDEFKGVKSDANYLKGTAMELSLQYDEVSDEFLVNKISQGLMKLHKRLNTLFKDMQSEFADLDKIRRDYINSQVSKQ